MKPNEEIKELQVYSLGTVEYGLCWALQNKLHQQCVELGVNSVIVVQHPPVITLGKNADPSFVLFDRATLERDGVSVFEIDRGGEATLHNPGQLVIYPILRLADWGVGPKQYIQLLEHAVIETLRLEGVDSSTDKEFPGVWVGAEKICAVGVRVKERATLHGLALNVGNDLGLFSKIVPCGISARSVTSLEKLTGRKIDLDSIAQKLILILAKSLHSRAVGADAAKLLAELGG